MKTRLFYWIAAATAATVVSGCASPVQTAINEYRWAAEQVQVGQPKEDVLAILEPTQEMLPPRERRAPERYIDDEGRQVEIYFFRSNHYQDRILTDDEFTPYVFRDGQLHSIGWTAIGGPRTQAMPPPREPRFHFGTGFGYYRIR